MAELERLLTVVRESFGPVRIWLTEYGYQTDPPDLLLGVPPATQAAYVASSARRVYVAPQVDMLIYYLVYDDAAPEGWQSGFFTANGTAKPSYTAFRFPLVQVSRTGDRVALWGQIRPRSGSQPYRLGAVPGRQGDLARRHRAGPIRAGSSACPCACGPARSSSCTRRGTTRSASPSGSPDVRGYGRDAATR